MKILALIIFLSLIITTPVLAHSTPSDWESTHDLMDWLKQHEPNITIIADRNGEANFDGHCEDIAFQVRDDALRDGKWLETEILSRAECIKYRDFVGGNPYRMDYGEGHYVNKARIGNSVYYVNGITDRIWFAYYLD